MAKGKRLTTEEFVEKAKSAHGGIYSYERTLYINAKVKIEIICPEHGSFWQNPSNHLRGNRCPKCNASDISKRESFTQEEWVKKARLIHGDKYDYSKVEYKSSREKVKIICPKHGEFEQQANSHLQGSNCNKCHFISLPQNQALTQNNFIQSYTGGNSLFLNAGIDLYWNNLSFGLNIQHPLYHPDKS